MASSVRTSRLVFQLDKVPTWFENLAVTASGTILVSRVDAPEVWEIDPATGKGEHLVSFPAPNTSVTGIAEFKPGHFAIGVGQYDLQKGAVPGTMGVWILDLSAGATAKPEPKHVVAIPPVGLLNGMTTWDDSHVLLADSLYGKVYMVDLAAGSYAVAIEDDLMSVPPDAFVPLGVNGIKLNSSGTRYLYFTNSCQMLVGRVPVGPECKAVGKAEVLARGVTTDDLALSHDEKSLLVTTHGMNTIVSIDIAGAAGGNGELVTICGDKDTLEVAGATACAFGRREADKNTLYITCAGALSMPVNGQVEPAKLMAVEL